MNDSLGQLIMTGIAGTSLNDKEKDFIEKENIGGVILFSRNYDSPAQLAELTNSIQTLRSEHPLFISVDHEGGRVMRFRSHFSQFPSMNTIAETNSPKICYEVHRIMAEELYACGINLSFSPVCDILTNPLNKVIGDRSFGNNTKTVSSFVTAAIRGLQANGVLACAKHFPGHGSTSKDSHFDLPIVKTSYEDLKNNELIPFYKASKARVEFLMVAHLIMDCIDENIPSSLSPKIYKIIRDDLKFSKIIITDDMEMKAIANKYSTEEAAIMAIEAGSDIILYQSMEMAKKAYNSLQDAVKTKRIKKKDIMEKIERVETCKKKNISEYTPIYIPSIAEKLNNKNNQEILKSLTKNQT